MKKTHLLVTALMFVSSISFAQLAVGLKAGLNFNSSTIDGASAGSSVSSIASTSTGFHFGAYAVAKLGPIGIQPEIYYSVQGSDISIDGAKGAITANYVQIPILLRLNFLKVLNFHAGPQFGLVLTNEMELDTSTDIYDLKDATKGADVSIAAGVGLDLPMGLSASVRYVQGLSDLADSASLSTSGVELDAWKNAMFQVSIGYTLFGRE